MYIYILDASFVTNAYQLSSFESYLFLIGEDGVKNEILVKYNYGKDKIYTEKKKKILSGVAALTLSLTNLQVFLNSPVL